MVSRYALSGLHRETMKAKLQKFGIFYDRKFDFENAENYDNYVLKDKFDSPHSYEPLKIVHSRGLYMF